MQNEPPITDQDLTSLLDDARAGEAARERSRRRWLQQQAQEDARLVGVFLDAAAHGHTMTVRTTSGQSHRGRVSDVGADWCALSRPQRWTLVHIDAVATILPDRAIDALPPGNHRPATRGTTFVEAMADLAADRPLVTVEFRGPTPSVRGEVLAVGADVATLRPADGSSLVYVSLASVAAVSLPSG